MTKNVWGGDVDGVQERTVHSTTPEGYTPEVGRVAWINAVTDAGTLLETARMIDRDLLHGVQYQIDNLGGAHVVGMVAVLQDVRRSLAQTEALLAAAVGRDEATPPRGVLPDGRQYEVRKGANRKAWDHDAWKSDVRHQALAREGVKPQDVLVNPETGEGVQVYAILRDVQEAHGSAAPRATALRALGLDPDDYCESVPGSWSVQVVGDSDEG